jgi:hypothetical protein
MAGGELLPRIVTKAVMLEVSRLIEHAVAGARGPVTVAVGFQHERNWRIERRRYLEMEADVVALAVADPGPSWNAREFVRLSPEHPMASEWFVVALGPTLRMTLCGLDLNASTGSGPIQDARQFLALYSMDADVARAAMARVLSDPEVRRQGTVVERLGTALRSDDDDPAAVDRAAAIAVFERAKQVTEDRQRLRDAADRGRAALPAPVRPTLGDGTPDAVAPPPLTPVRASEVDAEGSVSPEDRLAALVARYGTRSGVAVRLSIDPAVDLAPWADDVVGCVRELLDNAVKHSGARDVHVELRDEPGALLVRVADDGCGIARGRLAEARERGHLGIALLLDRMQRVGGDWRIETAEGQGTTAVLTFPRDGSAAGVPGDD